MTSNKGKTLDLCGGVGRLTIEHNKLHNQEYLIEELDENVIPFLLFNLAHKNVTATVYQKNVLTGEKIHTYTLQRGQKYSRIVKKKQAVLLEEKPVNVISNPPFNLKQDKCTINGVEFRGLMNYAFIERAITDIVKKRAESSKCLLVAGARQVGKSTLIRHQFSDYNGVSFDDKMTRLQAKEEPKLFFLNNPCPLFIDEVQKEKSILEDVKLILDDSEKRGQFIFSVSQKLELMKGMSESLAGRVSILELTGLALREINGVKFNDHFIPTDEYLKEREGKLVDYNNIWEIIHKGSYPELYDVDREWQDFYSSYVDTYLERDINELITADSITFLKFLTAVAARTGELLNYANIADDVGVSVPTVKNWVSILERTGIIFLLQPYKLAAT